MEEIRINPDGDVLEQLVNAVGPKGRGKRTVHAPAKGYSPNPLVGLPRNMPCPCGSKVKFKKCCLLDTKPYVPTEALAEYRRTRDEALAGGKAW
jgi:hypothetical protein